MFGQTPDFSHEVHLDGIADPLTLRIHRAMIQEANIGGSNAPVWLEEMAVLLKSRSGGWGTFTFSL